MTVRARKLLPTATAVLVSVAALALAAPVHAQDGRGEAGPQRQPRLTKPPKMSKFVEAEYPAAEKSAGKTSSVVLEIAIDDAGKVQDVVVVTSGGKVFDDAAIAAAKQFVFDPAEIDFKPAPVKITYRYDFTIKVEPTGPVVNFEGVVKNRFTKKPLAGITIQVDALPPVKTDDLGHFELAGVAEGAHKVVISGPGLATIETDETIEKGKKLEVKYAVEPQEEAIEGEEKPDVEVVTVGTRIQKQSSSTAIDASEGRRVAGTGGDTLKVVQNLPGVARAALGSGALVVWGAAPQDTRVYVEGVRVPLLYHMGGFRSTINSDVVRGIELAPGGYGAQYGRGLGGLVTVDLRTLRSDGVHGYVSSDLIDGSAMVEAPIDAKTRVAVAARKSWLDRTLSLFTAKDVSAYVPIPSYWDGVFKVERDLRPNESVSFVLLGSGDSLVRTVPNVDPAQVKSEQNDISYWRTMLLYKRQFEDGSSVFLTPSYGRDHSRTLSRFGGAPTDLDIHSEDFGLRAGHRARLSPLVTTTVGLDFEATRSDLSRVGAVTLPPREGDVHVFGQPPGDQVNADDWHTALGSVAPYFQGDFALFGDRLHVTAGVRLDAFFSNGSRVTPVTGETPAIGFTHQETFLEPRIAVRWQASDRVSLKAAFGVYHQSPLAEDLSAVFGNPSLGIARATHLLIGGAWRPIDGVAVEATVFGSKSSNLASRSASETPLLAQALVMEGEGRAYGGQILVRKELAKGFFGWVSYSMIRSERMDHPGNSWRLFDYDQTHVATLVGSYDMGRGWELGARVRYTSGFPRTPVVGAYFNTRRDLYEPYFGAQNTARIPAFFAVDLRLAKRWILGGGPAAPGEAGEGKQPTRLEVFLDVQNVTNRSNREDVVYDYAYRTRDYITGLPILPVLGARLEW
jgi:TonB family protein